MITASRPHSFLGIDGSGRVGVVRTAGNHHTHLVLRGGEKGPNFAADAVFRASVNCRQSGINSRVLIDASHDNSRKNPNNPSDPPRADDGRTLLSLGIIRAYKGIGDAIEAAKNIDGARLLVAGDPLESIDAYRAAAGDTAEWRLGYL